MKEFNEKQIKFLQACKQLKINDLIDTGELLFDLTIISKEIGDEFISWDIDALQHWYKENNMEGQCWQIYSLIDWIDEWISDEWYEEDSNDKVLLNSLGWYYKRYRYRKKL